MTPAQWIVLVLVALRLAELAWSARNARGLRARGAREVAPGHYPLFVLLHAAWLLLIALSAGPEAPNPFAIAALGPYWTTRILTLPGVPLVRVGPYRWFRHPNYAVVAAEIALLPLAFGLWRLALVFSLLNGLLLWHRICQEDRALEDRRRLMRRPMAR